MKIRILTPWALPVLVSLSLAGCGDPPQPVDAQSVAPKPALKPASGRDPVRVAGTIVFEGAAFDAPTGTLYVSVCPKGERMPIFSRQYTLQDGAIKTSESGQRTLSFEVGALNFIGQGGAGSEPPAFECDLAAKYKENSDALSKTLADAIVPYQAGKTDYVLTLELP